MPLPRILLWSETPARDRLGAENQMPNGLLLTILLLLGGLSWSSSASSWGWSAPPPIRRRPERLGQPQSSGANPTLREQSGRRGIDLDLIERVGEYAESTDGTYRLTWSDLYRGEPGGYVLKRGNSKLCSGKLAHPSGGRLAMNGTFILVATGRTFRVYGFSSDGEKILNLAFRAWPYSTGISDSGKFAVVQLASASSKEAKKDGGALVFLDLTTGKVRWKRKPETGWAESYRFDDLNRKLGLVYERYGMFEYSYEDGRFEDSDNWLGAGSGTDQVRTSLLFAEKNLQLALEVCLVQKQRNSSALSKRLLTSRMSKTNDRIIAKALRLSGEIHEQAGDFHQAIEQYERALGIDEKVGVKLKLQRLRKMRI